MFSLIDIDKIKKGIIDKATEIITEKVKEITDGVVSLESIVGGQVKIDANGYVDKSAEFLNETLNGNGLNELNLPDFSMDFERDIACGIVLPGKSDFSNGKITGLATFGRMGDAELRINALSEPMVSVKASMGIKQTTVEYLSKISVLCFPLDEKLPLSGTLKNITLLLHLIVDKKLSFSLDKFEVSNPGDLDLDFKSFGPFEFLAEQIAEEVKPVIKGAVLEYMEKSVKEFLNQIVSTLPITL